MFKNYYRTLGIAPTATDEEIKTAYRKLTKQYHPDTYKGPMNATEIMTGINQAYAVLHDKEARKKYDVELIEYEHKAELAYEERLRESRRRAAKHASSQTAYSDTSSDFTPETKDYHEEYDDNWCIRNGFEVLKSKYTHAEAYKEHKRHKIEDKIVVFATLAFIAAVIYGLDVLIRGPEATRLFKVVYDFVYDIISVTIQNYKETGRLIIG